MLWLQHDEIKDAVIDRVIMESDICVRRRGSVPDEIMLLKSHASIETERDDCFFPVSDNEKEMRELEVNESEEMLI